MPLIPDSSLLALGEKLIADIKASQKSKGLVSSGRSADSLGCEAVDSNGRRSLRVTGLSRFRFQQSGRGPNRSGKPALAQIEGLREWLKHKGLNIPVYAIAVKQAREGTPVPNPFNPGGVLSEPLEEDRVRGLAKVEFTSSLFKAARSILF